MNSQREEREKGLNDFIESLGGGYSDAWQDLPADELWHKACAWQAAMNQGGEAVAEITSGYSGDPDTRGNRVLKITGDIQKLPYGTKLYTGPLKPTDGDLNIDDYKEAFESHQKMVRELDVLINGEDGAAEQASLCDLVGQIEHEGLAKPTGGGVPDEWVKAMQRVLDWFDACNEEQDLICPRDEYTRIKALLDTQYNDQD